MLNVPEPRDRGFRQTQARRRILDGTGDDCGRNGTTSVAATGHMDSRTTLLDVVAATRPRTTEGTND